MSETRVCQCGREPLVKKRQRKCWRCKAEKDHQRAMRKLILGRGRYAWRKP